jgi:hypothetical protein
MRTPATGPRRSPIAASHTAGLVGRSKNEVRAPPSHKAQKISEGKKKNQFQQRNDRSTMIFGNGRIAATFVLAVLAAAPSHPLAAAEDAEVRSTGLALINLSDVTCSWWRSLRLRDAAHASRLPFTFSDRLGHQPPPWRERDASSGRRRRRGPRSGCHVHQPHHQVPDL